MGRRRRFEQILKVLLEWEAAVFVGHLWVVPRSVLGRAPVLNRSGREPVCGRDLRRKDPEVPAEEGRRSCDPDRAAGQSSCIVERDPRRPSQPVEAAKFAKRVRKESLPERVQPQFGRAPPEAEYTIT